MITQFKRKLYKARMVERDLTQPDICKRLGKSPTYVTNRFMGKFPWTIDEVFTLLDMIGQTPEAIGDFWLIKKEAN